jgi:hypothetical protein
VLGSSNTVVTLLNNGTGGFSQERLWTAGTETVAITTTDLDNDQKPDFLVGFDGSYSGYLKIFFNTTVSAPSSNNAPFDFDGDGKTDIGIFRPSGGEWWINRSGNGQTFALQFGSSTDVIAPADYTGDGKTDIAFFRPSSGEWYVLRSEDFSFFALPSEQMAMFRFRPITMPMERPTSLCSDHRTRTGSSRNQAEHRLGYSNSVSGGSTGRCGLRCGWKSDVGIFRQAAGGAQWWINRSSAGSLAMQFGSNTDKAVQGDYTGDGKADIAIWRPGDGRMVDRPKRRLLVLRIPVRYEWRCCCSRRLRRRRQVRRDSLPSVECDMVHLENDCRNTDRAVRS